MHTPLTFKANKKKASLVFIGSLCFVALGYWIAPQRPGIGWSCVVFFALCAAASLLMFLPNGMYLRLDDDGFEMGSVIRKERTGWDDIERFDMRRINGAKIIGIVYSEQYKRVALLRAVNRKMAGIAGAIPNSYDAPLDDIFQALIAWKTRYDSSK